MGLWESTFGLWGSILDLGDGESLSSLLESVLGLWESILDLWESMLGIWKLNLDLWETILALGVNLGFWVSSLGL